MSDSFTETRWTLLDQVRGEDPQLKQEALEVICGRYWKPLYWFVRRRGSNHDEAADAIQGFFAGLLETDRLARADRSRGKLRTFLLFQLKGYLSDRDKYRKAEKRSANYTALSIDSEEGRNFMETSASEKNISPEAGFDRAWARATLDHCVARLREERAGKGQLELFDALIPFVIGDGEESIKDVALQLNQEEGAVRVALHRLRKRLRELLREEVGKTLEPGGDPASELRYLASILE